MLQRVLGLLRDALRGAMSSRGAMLTYEFTSSVPANSVVTVPITITSDCEVWSYRVLREAEGAFMEALAYGAVNIFDRLDGTILAPPAPANGNQDTAQSDIFLRKGIRVSQSAPLQWRVRNTTAGALRITLRMECYIRKPSRS